MKICVLGSGSRGNSIFLQSRDTRLLIDAGFSTKSIRERLAAIGEDLQRIDAIFISHEHGDHIQALPVMSRRLNAPIFMTRGCAGEVLSRKEVRGVEHFQAADQIKIGDFTIEPFPVSHDAADPVGFVISNGGARVGVATDLGAVTGLVRQSLMELDALIIESNHDPDMLRDGPYPWELKQRIRSRMGHLANEDAASLISEVSHPGLKHIFLAHLSEKNNSPRLAFETSRKALKNGACLRLTCQEGPSEVIHIP